MLVLLCRSINAANCRCGWSPPPASAPKTAILLNWCLMHFSGLNALLLTIALACLQPCFCVVLVDSGNYGGMFPHLSRRGCTPLIVVRAGDFFLFFPSCIVRLFVNSTETRTEGWFGYRQQSPHRARPAPWTGHRTLEGRAVHRVPGAYDRDAGGGCGDIRVNVRQ